jgi:hypothetical protein
MPVQLLPRDARLHGDVEILRVEAHDAVHAGHVDADAAVDRNHVPFERRSRTERGHRTPVLRAGGDDGLHLHGRRRKHHRVGRDAGVVRFPAAMVLADGGGRGHTLADEIAQPREQRL